MKITITLFFVFLAGCSSITPIPTTAKNQDKAAPAHSVEKRVRKFATPEEVREFSQEVNDVYLVGSGDLLDITVWKRPEISNHKILVGANGRINILRIGFVDVGGRAIPDIQREITARLKNFYKRPEVTISMVESRNNRVFVLGRVGNPGEIRLPVIGSDLLKVLAMAGGLPVLDKRKAPLTECVITRGDKTLRINLRELLDHGNMALNARVRNNDVIFIPESGESENVYLIGEIHRPGIVRLVSGMTFFDALMMAGGPKESAQLEKTFLIRLKKGNGSIQEINLKAMLETADTGSNFLLAGGDVIFVSRSGLSRFQDFFIYLTHVMRGVDVTMSVGEKVGIMQELRRTWWGQEGFVQD